MHDAVIVSAVRTAVGKAPNGTLRGTRPDELAALGHRARRCARAPGLDPGRDRRRDPRLRDAGSRAGTERRAHRQPARRHSGRRRRPSPSTASARRDCRRSPLPPSASCAGSASPIVAGGTESMSLVPMGGHKLAPNPTLVDSYPDVYLSTGLVAENHARESRHLARRTGRVRAAQPPARARRHRRRAIRRRDRPGARSALTPTADGRRVRPSVRGRRRTAPRHVGGGAGQAAAGVPRHGHRHGRQLVADERRRRRRRRHVSGTRPRARPRRRSPGSSPSPPPASSRSGSASARCPPIRKALKLAGLTLDQIDLVELNEAFAAQVLACLRELPIDPDRLNVNGGAIALGHPLGCTGAKLTTTLVHEMQRRNARYGLVTMCVGGGMGAAGIFERL